MIDGSDRRFVSVAAIVAAAVFVADLNLPLDLAVSAIYGLVVLLGPVHPGSRLPARPRRWS